MFSGSFRIFQRVFSGVFREFQDFAGFFRGISRCFPGVSEFCRVFFRGIFRVFSGVFRGFRDFFQRVFRVFSAVFWEFRDFSGCFSLCPFRVYALWTLSIIWRRRMPTPTPVALELRPRQPPTNERNLDVQKQNLGLHLSPHSDPNRSDFEITNR